MSPTPEPALQAGAEVLYELRPLRERLLSDPRRWIVSVLALAAWAVLVYTAAVVMHVAARERGVLTVTK